MNNQIEKIIKSSIGINEAYFALTGKLDGFGSGILAYFKTFEEAEMAKNTINNLIDSNNPPVNIESIETALGTITTINDKVNHYDWLDKHFESFAAVLTDKSTMLNGFITAHGDKCYCYKRKWLKAGIPFPIGVAMYLMSYTEIGPDDRSNREYHVSDWVIDMVNKHRHNLPSVDLTDSDILRKF